MHRQLLYSHLSVALVGITMLLVALVSTYELRSRVIQLASESTPLSEASLRVLAGVQHSAASVRGWISLKDPRFLDEWHTAWDAEIQPAVLQMKQCGQQIQRSYTLKRLQDLQKLLVDLQEAQWWIQDIAHTLGNEPARLTYLFDAEPRITELKSLVRTLLHEENAQGDASGRKALLAELTAIQHAISTIHLLLRGVLEPQGLHHAEELQQQLKAVQPLLVGIAANPLLTAEQQQTMALLQRQWQISSPFIQKTLSRRQSANWNIALHQMTVETDPLTQQVITLTADIAARAQDRLEREANAVRAASAFTVAVMIATTLLMLAIAYTIAGKRARSLARPISALAEATRRLANGDTTDDLPVGGSAELGELTRSFNRMRVSMQQTQTKLREMNILLEERANERTAQLRDSEARLRAMTRAIPDLVFVVDEEGVYREVLAAGCDWDASRITTPHSRAQPPKTHRSEIPITVKNRPNAGIAGFTPIRGKRLNEVHTTEMAEFFLDIIHRALETRKIQVAEYELTTTSGQRWFESRTAPLDAPFSDTYRLTSSDTVPPAHITEKSAAIVVARDITKRKHAENQLRQAQKMQAIGQLTGGIAHDFNNLLAIIMGNLELLNEQLSVHPRLHELAHQALRAVDRGATLTRRLLVFARRQPLQAQPTDLNKLVLGTIDLIRRTLGASIQIETILAPDLEQTLIDPDQFESALLNLVINARDAMPESGQLILETTNAILDEEYAASHQDLRSGPYVMLSVSDTGNGMPPNVLERVFEPFFTTKETSRGSGLGLSMVYGLIKQSGGHITIYSEPGQGTTARLYLPQIKTEIGVTTDTPMAASDLQGQEEVILLVEDDPDVRRFAAKALEGLGYHTFQAGDAETALSLLNLKPQIALLFTDIVLPGPMDGVKLAAEVTRRRPGLPVLFTSGYTEHMLLENGRLSEGVEMLPKPYRKIELAKKLRVLLQRGADTKVET